MATPAKSHDFTAGQAALASQVNANFDAIIAGLKAGSTWDVVVASITTTANATVGGTLSVTGEATFDGDVTLGDAAGDTITVTGTATVAEDLTCSAAVTVGTTLGVTGATTCAAIDASGAIDSDEAISGKSFTPDTDGTTANTLYKANTPKAWANLNVNAGGAVAVTDGFNVASASWAGNQLTVNFTTNMGNATYAVFCQMSTTSGSYYVAEVEYDSLAVGTFDVFKGDPRTATDADWASSDYLFVLVFGDQ
jgi:hypothetical protein